MCSSPSGAGSGSLLLERAFVEQPVLADRPGTRRTKVIPGSWTEQSCLKLVFATLWQASQRWQGVRMSEFEQQYHPGTGQLRRLRGELGLLPPPASAQENLKRAARLMPCLLQQI